MKTPGEGRKLGRYELLFLLGQGGMGEVHLARLKGTAGFEKLCIVKTVLPSLMGDRSFIDRFHHEGRVLVQLTHSNIAQVYDMGEADGSLYMAIEYVSGVDLSRVETRVERQQLVMPVPVALYIGQQLTEALGYAHRKVGPDGAGLGIVHRDVSPQNVMVSYEGEVKVIDFGLAKSSARSKHTLPSTVMGKLGYMSPEQALAQPVDHRSDIFSAGIVIWELLAGRPMYPSGTVSEMVAIMARAEVPRLSDVRPDIAPQLEQVVMRALAREPAQRYQRADDFSRALNELAVRAQLTVGAEDVGNYVRAMCPEEFAAERQLQSKLSLLRRGEMNAVAAPPEVEGTLLRSSSPGGKQTPSGQSMTPAQMAMSVVGTGGEGAVHAKTREDVRSSGHHDAEISIPKSRTPLIVVGLVAFIALAGGALALMDRGEGSVPSTSASIAAPSVDNKASPVVAAVTPSEPERVDDAGVLAAPAESGIALKVEGKVWKVIRRDEEALMLLESGEKLEEGQRLNLVGEENEEGKRLLYGRGAVLSVKGSLATIVFDEEQPLPDKLFAARDKEPRPAHVKRVAPVNKTVATAPVERQVDPVPKPQVQLQPQTQSPHPVPAPVEERLSAPVLVAAPDVAPAPSPKAAPARNQLFGAIRVSPSAGVSIQSQNSFALTNCELRLPSNMVYRFGARAVSANETVRLALREFRADKRPADPQFRSDWAAMYCSEGTGYWKTSYEQK